MKKGCENLLAAALKKYMPEETILVTASRAEGRRILRVRDTGAGWDGPHKKQKRPNSMKLFGRWG